MHKGDKFGRLTVIEFDGRGNAICKCTCGNTTVVAKFNLRNEVTKSCGCLWKERIKEKKPGLYLDQKLAKNSGTGVKGVAKMKDGKYKAYITLEYKQKHLGVFETLEEAKQARLQAEKELYDPVLKETPKKPVRKRPQQPKIYSNNTSGHTGIHKYYLKNGVVRFAAQLTVRGVLYSQKGFKTLEEAVKHRKWLEKEYRDL